MTAYKHVLRAAALAFLLTGCDDLLEVEDPDVLKPDQLTGEAAIPTRVSGAIFDFAMAVNGNFNNGVVSAQGLFTDEYEHVETFPDRLEIDRRAIDRVDNQMSEYTFNALHVARVSAKETAALIEEFDPDNANLSMMHTIEGFTEVMLGETYCSGVPASSLNGNELVFGQPRTTQQVFEAAIAAFDRALAEDPNNNAAKVGRGRALLNLGRFADAAAAVASVPSNFQFLVRHSETTSAQNNGLWALSTNARVSVANNEAGEGLNFRSANDPRVPWEDTGELGFDEESPWFLQLVQPDMDSPVVVASGLEARLIQAEAGMQTGASRASFFSTHNALRASVTGLAPLTDTGQSTAALVDLHFRERAFWLYSTGHRLGDLRRLVRQYDRAANTVFPSGTHHKGTAYGSDVNFPIPVQEDNNPNTSPLQQGCLNRAA